MFGIFSSRIIGKTVPILQILQHLGGSFLKELELAAGKPTGEHAVRLSQSGIYLSVQLHRVLSGNQAFQPGVACHALPAYNVLFLQLLENSRCG